MDDKTDIGLIRRVRDFRDSASWRDFLEIYEPLIYRYGRSRGLSHDDAGEIVQETMSRLLQVLPEFEYSPAKGKFKHWLRRLVNNKINDMFKRRRPSCGADAMFELFASPDQDAAELWEQQWHAKHLRFCLKKVLASVNPTTRQAFELHVMSGWSVNDVTRVLKISPDQVYAAKSRVSQKLRTEVQALLGELPSE